MPEFERCDAQVLGISVNREDTNKRFAEKIGVTFPLLCDTAKAVSKEYGVLHPLFRLPRRVTFVVDKEGIIRHLEKGSAAVDPTGARRVCCGLTSEPTPRPS